jgi:hypothetical protein
MTAPISLSGDDIELLRASLDAYEYWELGRDLPRSDGLVFIPGDSLSKPDRFWPDEPDPEEAFAIDRIRRCRSLTARLAGHEPHA